MFRGWKMQTQFILRMVLAVLAIKYANAEIPTARGSYLLQLQAQNESQLHLSKEEINQLIDDLGITIDNDSKIYFHEENSFISIECFNCHIHNIQSNETFESSFNEGFLEK